VLLIIPMLMLLIAARLVSASGAALWLWFSEPRVNAENTGLLDTAATAAAP
jgi:hypothetical protein